jgi:hypothetical protein
MPFASPYAKVASRARGKQPKNLPAALTYRLPGSHARSSKYLQAIDLIGEPRWIRTIDPLIKSQMLYRLSYGLFFGENKGKIKQSRSV